MVLEIVNICGWYKWRELDDSGTAVRWSGPQNLHSEDEARDHHAGVAGTVPDEVRLVVE